MRFLPQNVINHIKGGIPDSLKKHLRIFVKKIPPPIAVEWAE